MKFSDSAFRLRQELEQLGGSSAARAIAEQALGVEQIKRDLERYGGAAAALAIADQAAGLQYTKDLETYSSATAARTIAEQAYGMQQDSRNFERLSGATVASTIADQLAGFQNSGSTNKLLDTFAGESLSSIAASSAHFGHFDSDIEALRKGYGMLDSLRSASAGLLGGDVFKALSKSQIAPVDLSRLLNVDTSAMATISQLIKDRLSISALVHDTTSAKATLLAEQFTRIQASYSAAMPRTDLASELVNSIGLLTSLQGQIGQLRLPTLDWASATAVARHWGGVGILEQLEALGISQDGTLQDFEESGSEVDFGSNLQQEQKTVELTVLLGIILALLVHIYQAQSAKVLQPAVEVSHRAIGLEMEATMRTLQALSHLVGQALQVEAVRKDTRFVVQQRAAKVVVSPISGATQSGTLLPREVVSLVSEQAKWIEVRYYDWDHREYRTGWVLKKYLSRVPPTREAAGRDADT